MSLLDPLLFDTCQLGADDGVFDPCLFDPAIFGYTPGTATPPTVVPGAARGIFSGALFAGALFAGGLFGVAEEQTERRPSPQVSVLTKQATFSHLEQQNVVAIETVLSAFCCLMIGMNISVKKDQDEVVDMESEDRISSQTEAQEIQVSAYNQEPVVCCTVDEHIAVG